MHGKQFNSLLVLYLRPVFGSQEVVVGEGDLGPAKLVEQVLTLRQSRTVWKNGQILVDPGLSLQQEHSG